MDKKERKENNKFFYGISIAGSIAFLLIIPVLIFVLIGLWLDNAFHMTPVFLITGGIIGFIGSMINVYRLMQTMK